MMWKVNAGNTGNSEGQQADPINIRACLPTFFSFLYTYRSPSLIEEPNFCQGYCLDQSSGDLTEC